MSPSTERGSCREKSKRDREFLFSHRLDFTCGDFPCIVGFPSGDNQVAVRNPDFNSSSITTKQREILTQVRSFTLSMYMVKIGGLNKNEKK